MGLEPTWNYYGFADRGLNQFGDTVIFKEHKNKKALLIFRGAGPLVFSILSTLQGQLLNRVTKIQVSQYQVA